MLPFLMRGLDLQDFQLRTEVINILLEVSEDVDVDLIAQHTSSLITAMLKSCISQDALSFTVVDSTLFAYRSNPTAGTSNGRYKVYWCTSSNSPIRCSTPT